jgi:arginyl-tRNA synthetase
MEQDLLLLFKGVLTHLSLQEPEHIVINRPELLSHGTYSTNIAFVLSKQEKTFPMVIAERIKDQLLLWKQEGFEAHNTNDDYKKILQDIGSIDIANPGFLNITFTVEAISRKVFEVLSNIQPINTGNSSKFSFKELSNHSKRVIIEYTDPNPFKELHIGHLYSNAVGESLARLLEMQGNEVRRVCYQGDVGMHVAKALWGMLEMIKTDSAENNHTEHPTASKPYVIPFEVVRTSIEQLDRKPLAEKVQWMGKCYAVGATAYEEENNAKEAMVELNVLAFMAAQSLHTTEKDFIPTIPYETFRKSTFYDKDIVSFLYNRGRVWSLSYFETRYALLGTTFEAYYFESFVAELGVRLVRDHIQDGIFKEDNGAVIFKGEEYGYHTRVFINSLGLPTYEAKELGLAPTKYTDWHYDRSIIVTAKEIDEYFNVLLTAMKQINPELADKTEHISHGVVKLPEGKMSSRTGNIKTADWLFHEVQEKVTNVLEKNSTIYSDTEKQIIRERATIAGIKYSLLKVGLPSDITFDLDQSVSLEGDSGVYLLYTYARATSVLQKHQNNIEIDYSVSKNITNLTQQEQELLRHLLYLSEVLEDAVGDLTPSTVARYVTDLAQYFNSFYAVCPIADDEFRLFLTQATQKTLKVCLWVLGMETVERM